MLNSNRVNVAGVVVNRSRRATVRSYGHYYHDERIPDVVEDADDDEVPSGEVDTAEDSEVPSGEVDTAEDDRAGQA